MSLAEAQTLQIAQAAQNLSFDSCFPSPGFSQGAMNPMVANNGCFASYDAFQGCGPAVNGFPNPAPQMPFASGSQDLSVPQFSYTPMAPVKAQPDLNDVIQLLSSMQMATSPTSVLAQRHLNQTGLAQHAFSADSSTTSGVGMSDSELESTQIANALMSLNNAGVPATVGPTNTLFGMTL